MAGIHYATGSGIFTPQAFATALRQFGARLDVPILGAPLSFANPDLVQDRLELRLQVDGLRCSAADRGGFGFGWHLVFVDTLTPGRVPAFEEVEADVKTARLAEQKAQHQRFMKSVNYGFERVERLEGNVGYIELRSFAGQRLKPCLKALRLFGRELGQAVERVAEEIFEQLFEIVGHGERPRPIHRLAGDFRIDAKHPQ